MTLEWGKCLTQAPVLACKWEKVIQMRLPWSEVRCTLPNSHSGDIIVLLIYSCSFHTPPSSFRRCLMRATVRAVLPVLLVLSLFSSTAITPRSSLAPAVEAAHTSHSDSDPTEPWLSSYLLAAGAPSLNDAEAVVYCGVLGSLAAVPGVLSTAPGRLSGGEHERRFGVYQMTVAHRQLYLSSGVNSFAALSSGFRNLLGSSCAEDQGLRGLARAVTLNTFV